VRRIEGPDGAERHRAVDVDRDQSYFLFATTPEQLEFLRFPLGDLTKSEARDLAKSLNVHVADKPDSQDICFVPDGRYSDVIQKLRPDAAVPGDIVHVDGRVVGQHAGVIHYTVGQRRGLGVGGEAEPLYVVAIEPDTAQVVVGPKSALLSRSFNIRSVNWLGPRSSDLADGMGVRVKLRNTHAPILATVFWEHGAGTAKIVLAEPEAAVTPGQACVLYEGDRVLGGGWIERGVQSHTVPHNLRSDRNRQIAQSR